MRRPGAIRWEAGVASLILLTALTIPVLAAPPPGIGESTRIYQNILTENTRPLPILADHPDFVEPLQYEARFLAPPVVNDPGGKLEVRSWRYWYNARGIIETVNRLDPRATAILDLMPWGVDDGGGMRSPEPAGIVLTGTPEKNALFQRQVAEVINPFLRRMGEQVALVGHTLPGEEDPVRRLLYPSMSTGREKLDVEPGARKLQEMLSAQTPAGLAPEEMLQLDPAAPLADYFRMTVSSHAASRYNGPGFERIPVPLARGVSRCPNDMVFYDAEGYERIRDFLKSRGIRHILVLGFIEKSTILPTHPRAGAENADAAELEKIGTAPSIERLGKDFNIFLVGDAVRTTFPGSATPKYAVQAALAKLSGENMITQAGWVKMTGK